MYRKHSGIKETTMEDKELNEQPQDIVCSGGIVLPELGIITNYLKELDDGE